MRGQRLVWRRRWEKTMETTTRRRAKPVRLLLNLCRTTELSHRRNIGENMENTEFFPGISPPLTFLFWSQKAGKIAESHNRLFLWSDRKTQGLTSCSVSLCCLVWFIPQLWRLLFSSALLHLTIIIHTNRLSHTPGFRAPDQTNTNQDFCQNWQLNWVSSSDQREC